ncbi:MULTISPECIES: DUF6380 family protein [Actinomycetes]|uniref:Uncharacterized protein n=1 Tax=Streptomyces griseofuscus TaxID=146922 RepID=A0A7H1PTX2_9ACTN|nr:hypothetical protein [Streptomyces murinus]QNT91502.1 hypothetical protein HEP81_01171 [Streptomyces griseofuscus]TGZ13976.1 hypothetical protein DV517_54590 [Streptomyces sp. S816]
MDLTEPADFHRATPRHGVASLTATTVRAPFNQHGRHARKDAP